MKEVVNKKRRKLILDLNSFDDDGRRKSLHLAPGESASITNDEALSKQILKAESIGALEIKDKGKKISLKKSSKEEEPIEEENLKKTKKEEKTTDKEDK